MTTHPTGTPAQAELPRPAFDTAAARSLLAQRYGIHAAAVRELGSQQDRNFLVEDTGRRLVLKVANSSWPAASLTAQDRALRYLATALPGLVVPVPVADPTVITIDGADHPVRLLSFVDGRSLADWDHLAAPVVSQLGAAAVRMAVALQQLPTDAAMLAGLDRWLQWDLRRAREVGTDLLPRVADPALRARVGSALRDACDRVDAVASALPVQVIHGDLTDDNVVASAGPDGRPVLTGVIDFGDLATGWRVAELAVACTSVLHHAGAEPASVLPAVLAFHRVAPLSDAELSALWPLIVARSAVLVVSGHAQLAVDPENDYAASGALNEQVMFDVASSVPCEVMHQLLRVGLGLANPQPCPPAAGPLLADQLAADLLVLDLSVTSPWVDAGAWEPADAQARLIAQSGGTVLLRHGEARLTRTPALSLTAPATVSIGASLHCSGARELRAPWAGVLQPVDDALLLPGPEGTLVLRGAVAVEQLSRPGTGQVFATVPPGGLLHVQLVTERGLLPPTFTTAALAPGWLAVTADPSSLLGLPAGTARHHRRRSAAELMAARQEVIAEAQERYYGQVPPQFERGWRDLMIDVDARSYVDTINNVTMIGHGDPRVAATAARQWLLLNTNSRFSYDAIVDYSARLAALFPAALDTVFLVNSGSEAVDLALRLAKAHSGHRDVVSINEAYHGWTEASDAVSTSLHDNPGAAASRPDWVHPVLAPNMFRGRFRGLGAAQAYADDVRDTVAALVAAGRSPAAFICEAMYGKEGAIALPDGYLQAAYAAVRAHGGLAIADEVQVGFGRLGDYLWGYEQQQVVPDIVTVAKAVGNGQPIGAVITRRDIAESFAAEGTFFSSAGGSGVSCAVGLTVLDIWESEQLQQNARDIGAHLRARFEALAGELRAKLRPSAAARGLFIGAVHGSGLYQGVELVRDLTTLEPATEETLALCDRVLDLGVIMQPTGENFNILKVKPPMCLTRASADHFIDAVAHALSTGW